MSLQCHSIVTPMWSNVTPMSPHYLVTSFGTTKSLKITEILQKVVGYCPHFWRILKVFWTSQSLQCHSIVTPLSLQCHSIVTPMSLQCQSIVTPMSLQCQSTIWFYQDTTKSLKITEILQKVVGYCPHFWRILKVFWTSQSLQCHSIVTPLSLQCHSIVTPMSLQCHSIVTGVTMEWKLLRVFLSCVACCVLLVVRCLLRVACCALLVARWWLRVAYWALLVVRCLLRVARCVLRVFSKQNIKTPSEQYSKNKEKSGILVSRFSYRKTRKLSIHVNPSTMSIQMQSTVEWHCCNPNAIQMQSTVEWHWSDTPTFVNRGNFLHST